VDVSIDTSELDRLSASFASATRNLPREVRAVVAKGALNVKNDTRKNVSDHPTWGRIAQTVNYDLAGNAFFSEAVVGYDDEGQGELAGIYEFGSATRDPHPTLFPAAERERPRFEKALADVAAKVAEDAL
jgi:hypothetical protein